MKSKGWEVYCKPGEAKVTDFRPTSSATSLARPPPKE